MKEHRQPTSLELDIQQTRWMLAFHEAPPPPICETPPLLAAPAPVLLLSAGSPTGEPAPALAPKDVVFAAGEIADLATSNTATGDPVPFIERLARLHPRIEQLTKHRWYEEYDVYELDNLVQAGLIHLWEAYTREPAKFDERGDGYWYRTAKHGAKREVIRGYRQCFRQRGTGSSRDRQHVETVLSAGDLLEAVRERFDGDGDEPDETMLDCHTIYHRETAAIEAADQRMDIPHLEQMIFSGTDPADHPLIGRILSYMREGMSMLAMARQEQVPPATIRCAIRRIRQACGAMPSAQANKRRDYGASKDERIRQLREQGRSGPEIARLIGTQNNFVYRRLQVMGLMPDTPQASPS